MEIKEIFRTENDYDKFKNALVEIEDKDVWTESYASHISMHLSDEGEFTLLNGSDEMVLHPLAIPTILDRAGVKSLLSASCLSKESEDKTLITTLVNSGLDHFGDKKCTILQRDGFAMAVHGSQYSVMPQSVGISAINDELLKRFDSTRFLEGSFSYEKTEVLFKIASPGDPLFGHYEKAWKSADLNTKVLEKTSAYVKVLTSDVGEYCFSLAPYLDMGGRKVPLGKALTVKHRGKNEIPMLIKCVDSCFSVFSDTLSQSIPKMMERTLVYPRQTLVRIITKLKFNELGLKLYANSLLEDFDKMFDTYSMVVDEYGASVPSPFQDTLTAFDIYSFIVESQSGKVFFGLTENSKIRIIEKLYQIPELDWDKLDQEGSRYLD